MQSPACMNVKSFHLSQGSYCDFLGLFLKLPKVYIPWYIGRISKFTVNRSWSCGDRVGWVRERVRGRKKKNVMTWNERVLQVALFPGDLDWRCTVLEGRLCFKNRTEPCALNLWNPGYPACDFCTTRIAERRFLTGLQRGYFFWGDGAAIHTQATTKPCRRPLHATESHVRLKHKLIQNIVPFWKTSVTKKKSTIFKWGLYKNF